MALASALALTTTSVRADVVWNVNLGNITAGTTIETGDDYLGAATENTANSTWNSVTSDGLTALVDSAGDGSAGATMTLTPASGTSIDIGGQGLTTGDKIFVTWIKNNSSAFDVTFGNLDPSATYDLVIYSDWYWHNGNNLPVTQTAGTGLASTFIVNRDLTNTDLTNGNVGPLLEDTDPADVYLGPTNYARITGLTPDGSNNLSFDMGGANTPLNGFQLIEKDLGDSDPPNPDPMEWAAGGEPAATGESRITMTATTATDPGGVEYYFTNETWLDDTHDSGWQTSPTYTDTGLVPGTPYSYTVKARDANENTTAPSTPPAEATTEAADGTAPTPNPMEWAVGGEPAAVSISAITMTAAVATDPEGNGEEYYFKNVTWPDDTHDSGWQDDPVYTDTGLLPTTAYAYTVTARDKSVGANEGAPSNPPAEETTNTPAPVNNVVWNVNIGNNIDETDDYVGAAPQNTTNSTWNSITADGTGMALLDSTGSGAAGVTMDLTGTGHGATAVGGDEIWQQWTKSSDNSTPFTLAFGNLNPSVTYDLVLYSEWFWAAEGGMPVTQTVGSGLAGTIVVNHEPGMNGDPVIPLAEDTDPADIDGPFNWYRITGLTPDASGNLGFSMGGVNGPFNGLQLIGAPKDTSVQITSFTSVGVETWQLTLEGDPNTDYEFRSSTTLDFKPGTLVKPLMAGVPAGGTIGGDNNSLLTTDSSGFGTVRMMLTGPANFVRAQVPPPPPLQGASFEEPETVDFTPGAPTHWTHENPTVGEVGVWLPLVTDDYLSIPDPSQVGYAYYDTAVPNAAFGLSQTLSANFAADTDYQVTVQVGRSKTYDWPNYRVELRAGGILLASDDNTLSPSAGGWVTSTVSYDHNTGPAATPGDALEIRLLSRGEDPEGGVLGGWSVEFDQVTFTATGP